MTPPRRAGGQPGPDRHGDRPARRTHAVRRPRRARSASTATGRRPSSCATRNITRVDAEVDGRRLRTRDVRRNRVTLELDEVIGGRRNGEIALHLEGYDGADACRRPAHDDPRRPRRLIGTRQNGARARGPRRPGDPARPRADRGQHLPRPFTRREPPAGVRRPGRRPGARRRGADRRRLGAPGALAARLLPAPRRPDGADPLRGRPPPRRSQLQHPARRRHPARPGDLQPAGQLPRPGGRSRPPAADAAGHARPGVAARLAHPHGAVQGPARRVVRPAPADRPALRRRRPDEPQGRAVGQPAGLAAGRRPAARRPGRPRLRRHLRQRHDAARHDGAAVRAGVGQPRHADGQPRPRDVVPPAVPRRRVAALRPARPLDRARRAASPAARSSPPTAGSSSASSKRAWPGWAREARPRPSPSPCSAVGRRAATTTTTPTTDRRRRRRRRATAATAGDATATPPSTDGGTGHDGRAGDRPPRPRRPRPTTVAPDVDPAVDAHRGRRAGRRRRRPRLADGRRRARTSSSSRAG